MFKLIFFLCSGLFLAMLVAGQDHGQQRFGLMAKAADPVAPAAVAVETAMPEPELVEVAFAPVRPVMTAPPPEPVVEATPTPSEPAGRILYIDAKSVNVRSGPGKDFDVVDRLKRGEAVLVVSEGEGPDGWSLIRIEGDGTEGYVAARLLRE